MRISDSRLGKFLSVDPLTKKYPWYTPYQFAGNQPIKYIDLDGLEPANPGSKQGQSDVAAKKGTEDFFNWSWNIDAKTKKGNWLQGSSTMYHGLGDVAHISHLYDNTKDYYKHVKVLPLDINQAADLSPLPLPRANDNSLKLREAEFVEAFSIGVSGGDKKAKEDASIC